MEHERPLARLNVWLGCGLITLVLVIGLALSLVVALDHERDALRYPNAIIVPAQTSYQIAPTKTGMTALYRSGDNFEKVRDWYKQQFNMILLEEDIGSGCIVLEGRQQRLIIERYTFVSICATAGQQTIFVNHSASLP